MVPWADASFNGADLFNAEVGATVQQIVKLGNVKMRLEFKHPVIAKGVHGKSLAERMFVGMVTTPAEIPELSSSDVTTAFEIEAINPDHDRIIVQYGEHLYSPAKYDIADLVAAADFEQMSHSIKGPFRSLANRLVTEIRTMAAAGTMSMLFPRPKSPKVATPDKGDDDPVINYVSKSPVLPTSADALDVERWHGFARDFLANFIVVDGKTYRRTGVPIYCVGSTYIKPVTTHVFRKYLDEVTPWDYGGARPGTGWGQGLMVRADELREARVLRLEMAKRTKIDTPPAYCPRIICHADYPVPDLEHLELARFAKRHLIEVQDKLNEVGTHFGDAKLNGKLRNNQSLREYVAAGQTVRAALDAHELVAPDINGVEESFRQLSQKTKEYCYSLYSKVMERRKELSAESHFMLERLESMPIDVPMFGRRPSPHP